MNNEKKSSGGSETKIDGKDCSKCEVLSEEEIYKLLSLMTDGKSKAKEENPVT